MSDPTTDFFEALAARGQEPLLRRTSGTVRFDLLGDDGQYAHWYVAIARGVLAVSREHAPADCVVFCRRELFDRLACGTANAMASALRGVLGAQGDLSLLIRFQRLFPGPPGDRERREAAGYARRTS
jgi:hypothetical protein